jgi:hypothetical protein
MPDYPIERVLDELVEKKAVRVEELALPNRTVYLLMDVSKEKIVQLSRETSKDRPRKGEQPSKHHTKHNNHSPVKQDVIDYLINIPTARQRKTMQDSKAFEKILLKQKQAERNLMEKFKFKVDLSMFCNFGSSDRCRKERGAVCRNVHYRRIIHSNTDVSLGD